jgi:hypothetical protein
MQSKYLAALLDDDFPALAGVSRELFDIIYATYCKESIIDKPYVITVCTPCTLIALCFAAGSCFAYFTC